MIQENKDCDILVLQFFEKSIKKKRLGLVKNVVLKYFIFVNQT